MLKSQTLKVRKTFVPTEIEISTVLFCFGGKTNPWFCVVCITDSEALQTDRALGLCAFLTTHREAMDWFVSLGELFKNTPCCDAQGAALGARDSAQATALQVVRAALI